MKRYLLLLSVVIGLSCIFQSCKDEQELNPCGISVLWGADTATVLFPEGCLVDEYSITYDGEPVSFDGCNAVLYTEQRSELSLSVDLECRISNDTTDVLDIIMHNTLIDVSGPEGYGYVETFVYFRGGFWAFLTDYPGDNYDYLPTTPELRYNGVEYPVSSFYASGIWHNNREWRCKYGMSDWKEITKNLEYTDCNIIIGLEVGGKPLTLNITHISPL